MDNRTPEQRISAVTARTERYGPTPSHTEEDARAFEHADLAQANQGFGQGGGSAYRLLGGFKQAAKFERDAPYILKGLLAPGDFSLIYGPSGSGKSFFLLSLLAHVSAGADSFLSRRIPEGGAAVLGIFCEGQSAIQKRMAALEQELGDRLDLANAKFDWIADAPQVSEDSGVDNVLATCDAYKDAHGHYPELVAIDTLSRAFGAGDENSSQAMMAFVQGCQRIQRETGAHVCVVHHTGKSVDAGARGHSSLRAALDASLAVEVDQAGNRAVRVDKAKDAEDGLSYGIKLTPVSLGYDMEGDEITSLVAEPAQLAKIKPKKQPRKTDAAGQATTATVKLAKSDKAQTHDTDTTAHDNEISISEADWTEWLVEQKVLDFKPDKDGYLTDSSRTKRKRIMQTLEKSGILRRSYGPNGQLLNDRLYFNHDMLLAW